MIGFSLFELKRGAVQLFWRADVTPPDWSIFQNGSVVQTLTALNAVIDGLLVDTDYSFSVQANYLASQVTGYELLSLGDTVIETLGDTPILAGYIASTAAAPMMSASRAYRYGSQEASTVALMPRRFPFPSAQTLPNTPADNGRS